MPNDPASDGTAGSGGTYVLLVALSEDTTVTFGAAGTFDLDAGTYAYAGSAFGPGGLSRVDRHRELAAGDRETRHWHVDYLLGIPASTLVDVVATVGRDRECAVAAELASTGTVLPLGASDCACRGHLVGGSRRSLADAARRVLAD